MTETFFCEPCFGNGGGLGWAGLLAGAGVGAAAGWAVGLLAWGWGLGLAGAGAGLGWAGWPGLKVFATEA